MDPSTRRRDHNRHSSDKDSTNTASIPSNASNNDNDNNTIHNPPPLHHPHTSTTPSCPPPGSITNLCSATLGAGALSLPYAFSLTGLVPGILLLLVSGILTILSIDVIVSSCVQSHLIKYEDVAVRWGGRTAGRILEASLLVFCFGTAVAYIVAVGDILDRGIRSLLDWNGREEKEKDEEDDAWWIQLYSRERVMIVFWLCVMFPLSLQRHVEGLEKFSSLGVLSIVFLVLAAVIHCIGKGEVFVENGKNNDADTTEMAAVVGIGALLWPESFWDVVRAFPIIIFAFSCQVNVCAIFEELTPREEVSGRDYMAVKEQMMKRITRFGITLCIFLYLSIGIFGYLDFAHGTLDNILNNYNIPVTHDSLMIAASIFVAVAIVVAFPFNILPARVTLKLILDRLNTKKCGTKCGILSRFFGCAFGISHSRSSSFDDSSHSLHVTHFDDGELLLRTERDDGIEPLLLQDTTEQSVHIPPLSFSDNMNHKNSTALNLSSNLSTSTMEHFMLTLFLSGSALIVALLVPGISILFGLMGGTAASVISFILPGLFLQQMEDLSRGEDEVNIRSTSWDSQRRKVLSRAFIWGGVVTGVLTTGVTLYGLLV
eukprot:CCRYP_010718-RA/>CCRYP_010718-RA protein AED:0.01 eAED:0.00 QI:0/0/0/1/1/1/2/0/599